MKNPWMKWYPSDWRGDPLVKACEPLTRYVWIEMLGLMHDAQPYGHLVLNGRPMDAAILGRVISVDPRVVASALRELESFGVFSRTDDGVIFSRRMVRDRSTATTRQVNGCSGGNPTLMTKSRRYKNQRLSEGLDNHPDNPQDKPQKLEARSQSQTPTEKEPTFALTGEVSAPPPDGWPSDAWERFWSRYPHKVGKPEALKSFNKVRKGRHATWEVFLSGLDLYVNKRDDRPWCNPTTWLNQHRWADQPANVHAPRGQPPRGPTFLDIASGNFTGEQNGQ